MIAIVTGANTGIGLETAVGLANKGAKVILVARNEIRGEDGLAQVKKRTGNDDVHLLLADMSSLSSVRSMADTFRNRFKTLDVLVNNAGALIMNRGTSPEGHELTFATNHLGPFLLTHLLLDLLRDSGSGRVVNVSSTAHRRGSFSDVDHLPSRPGSYAGWSAYGDSKLCNLLFTFELARRLRERDWPVTANACHPGIVSSQFGRRAGGYVGLTWALMAPFITSPKNGADTQLWLASSDECANESGHYFVRRRRSRTTRLAQDQELQRKLWALSVKLTGMCAI